MCHSKAEKLADADFFDRGGPMRRAGILFFFGAVACASLPRSTPDDSGVIEQGEKPVRIALATRAREARIGGVGEGVMYNRSSVDRIMRGKATDEVQVEIRKGRLSYSRGDFSAGNSRKTGPYIFRSVTPGALLKYDGKRYRGELIITPRNGGLLVVNRLGVESYLRGVVPLEIGVAKPGEEAAVEAQAVAARSYTYIHIAEAGNRGFDMYGSVQDQAYGGADAEKAMTDAAVAKTRDLVLRFAGRIINTPYSSTCGGRTAEVKEVWWRRNSEPYLKSVSDQIPGTDRYYCDISGRFRWNTEFTGTQLQETLEKYLASVTPASEPPVSANSGTPRLALGRVTDCRINARTPSDRVESVSIQTDRRNYVVRGNDVRFILRAPSGGLLNSTYFTAETSGGGGSAISRLSIRGGGWGHGIGMCQWGAIGRARAGQDYKTILTTYYSGTTVGPID